MKPLFVLLVTTVGAAVAPGLYDDLQGRFEYAQVNSYVMWFVQGADTLGQPVQTTTSEVLDFERTTEGLRVSATLSSPDFSSANTYDVDGSGRVLAVDGVPASEAVVARVDLLPRVPHAATQLAAGQVWADTVSHVADGGWGEKYYRATRQYRVVGETAVGDRTAVLLVSDGFIQIRQGGWEDEARGDRWWQEIQGPVVDTVWVGRDGRLFGGATHMDLVGQATFERGGATAAMPSGLRSSVRRTPAG